MTMTDERNNLPSASYIAQIAACPGSWEAQQGLADIVEDDTTQSGVEIHDWLKDKALGQPVQTITPIRQSTADECWRMLNAERRSYFGDDYYTSEVQTEKRLWMLSEENDPILSAKLDFLEVCGDRALVVDYKTGWEGAEPAHENLQLRTQALCVEQWFLVERVRVIIIAPNCTPSVTISDYTKADLRASQSQIQAIVASAKNGKRVPGEQCRWCRAKHVCPEALAIPSALPLALNVPPDTDIASRSNGDALRSRLQVMTGDQLGKMLEAAKVAEWVIDQVKAHAKQRLADGEKIDGWTLKPGRNRRTVTSAAEALKRINGPAATLTLEQFLACVSVKISELDAVFKTATSLKSTDAKAELERRLGDVIERKTDQPSLERE